LLILHLFCKKRSWLPTGVIVKTLSFYTILHAQTC
jgi:hypothetical protein